MISNSRASFCDGLLAAYDQENDVPFLGIDLSSL
jgi:hypothetical protein